MPEHKSSRSRRHQRGCVRAVIAAGTCAALVLSPMMSSAAPSHHDIVTGPARTDCAAVPAPESLPMSVRLTVTLPTDNPYNGTPRSIAGYSVRVKKVAGARAGNPQELKKQFPVDKLDDASVYQFDAETVAVTTMDGHAVFDTLAPGLYVVQVTPPAGSTHGSYMEVEPLVVMLPTINENCDWNSDVTVFVKTQATTPPPTSPAPGISHAPLPPTGTVPIKPISTPVPKGETPAVSQEQSLPTPQTPRQFLAQTGASSWSAVLMGIVLMMAGAVLSRRRGAES